MIVTGQDEVCKEIAAALGIKSARKLILSMEKGKLVTVEAEFYPEINGVKQLVPILKKYELCEIV